VKVVLNGAEQDLPETARVRDAVLAAGAEPDGRGLAVAVDGEVVPRSDWERAALRAGQRVEVLQAVQGG
jgi:sulfur carrier protein